MAVWSSINMSYGLANKRLDAERYKPQYLKNEKFLSSIKFEYLKKYISDISGGATPKGAKYPNNGIRFVRVQNIRDNFFDLSDVVYIDETVHNGQLFRSQIQESDVLLTITGVSYGNSSTAYKEMLPANINQHSVRIALKSGLLPEVLSTFFCCKYGRLQSDSKVTGDTRPALTYPEIGNYIIPIFDMDNQVEIQKLVKESLQQRLLSHSLYHQAEELLAQELQLDQLKLPNKKWYSTQYGEVLNRLRSDAEFYNPKLAQYYEHFSHIGLDLKCICDFVKVKKFSNPTYAKEGLPIITQRHLSVISPENYGDFPIADPNWCNKNTEAVLKKEDLLYYSVGAYLGKTNVWLNEDNAVFASFITLMRCKNVVDSCYLMLLLNSPFGILQSKVFQSGTSQPYIYPKDIKQFLVPDITREQKEALFDLVHKSYSAMNQSKQLLAQAKHRVEELIEQEANKY